MGLSACNSKIPRLAFTENLKLSGLAAMGAAGKMFDLFSYGAARRMRSHLDGIYTLRVSNHFKAPDLWKTMPINVKFHAFFNLSIQE